MNRPDLLWVRQIQGFEAFFILGAGTLQLRAHRPIHQQNTAGPQGFHKVRHVGIIAHNNAQLIISEVNMAKVDYRNVRKVPGICGGVPWLPEHGFASA